MIKKTSKGLRRISKYSDQRQECVILKIGQKRFLNYRVEFQVFWEGYESTWEPIEALTDCDSLLGPLINQSARNFISSRRRSLNFQPQEGFNGQQNAHPEQNAINLISSSESCKLSSSKNLDEKSVSLEEGEMQLEEYKPAQSENRQSIQSHENQSQQIDSEQIKEEIKSKDEDIESYEMIEEQKNEINYYDQMKLNQAKNKKSAILQNTSACSSTFENSSSVQKIHVSQNFKITSCCTLAIHPSKKGLTQKEKGKKSQLCLERRNLTVEVLPTKNEELFVTKSFKLGNRIEYEILQYNKNGQKMIKRMSAPELRVKAPYALIKYYESRLVY